MRGRLTTWIKGSRLRPGHGVNSRDGLRARFLDKRSNRGAGAEVTGALGTGGGAEEDSCSS
jgi:hypothetical protein